MVSVIPVISSTVFAVSLMRVVSSLIVSFSVLTFLVIPAISSFPFEEASRVSLQSSITSLAFCVSWPEVLARSVAEEAISSIEEFISFRVELSFSIESP